MVPPNPPDDDDRTVLRKPGGGGGGGDKTVLRPTPGRRRGGGGGGAPSAPAPRQAAVPRESVSVDQFRTGGVNPLVDAASTLLALVGQLRNTGSHPNIDALRRHVESELKSFQGNAQQQGIASQTIVAARYCLCTMLDETVLSTPWGVESPWSQHTLLGAFHKETWGGEKFFAILDRMVREPARNLDMLELLYISLALGFQGKYRVQDRGQASLDQIQENLYSAIRHQRGEFERDLSPRWQGVVDRRNALVRYVPLWVVAAFAGVLLVALYVGFNFSLNGASDPVFSKLQAIGRDPTPILERNVPPPPPPPKSISLRTFLQPEIEERLLDVYEQTDRTTVVLRGDGLFASGSVTVKSEYLPVIERVADALAEVQGNVLITGHTDNDPIRSARFPSNWHLSQARADAVKKVVAQRLGSDARLKAEGRGDTEPLVQNNSRENKARNRRVELSLLTGGTP